VEWHDDCKSTPPLKVAPLPEVFAPSRLARLERKVRRLASGNVKAGLPDGLAPSEGKGSQASPRQRESVAPRRACPV
jgi:hypothetical protein